MIVRASRNYFSLDWTRDQLKDRLRPESSVARLDLYHLVLTASFYIGQGISSAVRPKREGEENPDYVACLQVYEQRPRWFHDCQSDAQWPKPNDSLYCRSHPQSGLGHEPRKELSLEREIQTPARADFFKNLRPPTPSLPNGSTAITSVASSAGEPAK